MLVKDKGYGNVSVYQETGAGLQFDIGLVIKNNSIERGIIKDWELVIGDYEVVGYGIESLTDEFHHIIKLFDLKQYSKCKKDILVIYVDNLNKIRGYFRNLITEDFTHYVQLLNFLEFRDITPWKEIHNAKEIADYAQFLINEIFIPNRYFYITVPQSVRKRLAKACKDEKNNIAKDIYPETYCRYGVLKMALFGGLCFCPYPNLIIEEPMIEIDLDSAYIFDFLVEKHCMSAAKEEDPNNWEYFLESNTRTSLGKYTIKYACSTNKAHCYKNYKGENVAYGEHTDTFIFTDIDLKIFMSLVTILSIDCDYLTSYELDNLPKYMRDTLVTEYVKKEQLKLKGKEDESYLVQKAALNSIYGSTIRNIDNISDYKKDYKDACICPQWGIWTTAYCKKYLLSLATKIDGWYYSDTDSIYCKDTEENRKLIKEFNEMIQAKTKAFCEKFGYDFENLKKIGTFEIKNEIKKFKAIKQKIYMYTTTDDRLILKAAGCNRREVELDDSIYYLKKIPVGERTFGYFTDDSYYELTLKNEAAEYMTLLMIAADRLTIK